eukprot:495117-Prymnesium_polylepis.2
MLLGKRRRQRLMERPALGFDRRAQFRHAGERLLPLAIELPVKGRLILGDCLQQHGHEARYAGVTKAAIAATQVLFGILFLLLLLP